MDQDHDLLLDLTGSQYKLNPNLGLPEKAANSSFNNLVMELFQQESPVAMETTSGNIEQDFAEDSQHTEEKLKQWLEISEQQQQQQAACVATSMGSTLEYPTVQMTQQPQVPPREGLTPQSFPSLPVEVLHQQQSMPVLPVFHQGTVPEPVQQQQQQQQPIVLTIQDIDAVLSLEPSPTPTAATATTTEEASTSVEDIGLDRGVRLIERAIKRYHSSGASVCSNGRPQVHEVVMALVLADQLDLSGGSRLHGLLTFCTEDGSSVFGQSDNFMAKDTKAMGKIWQRIKGNRNANFDTFARAMRVGRERQRDYFGYLDCGRNAKKRIYKLGPKCRKELDRMRKALETCLVEDSEPHQAQ